VSTLFEQDVKNMAPQTIAAAAIYKDVDFFMRYFMLIK
jgi:hypothetical protein